MESYSKRTKEALKALIPKKNCCKRIADDFARLEKEEDIEKQSREIDAEEAVRASEEKPAEELAKESSEQADEDENGDTEQ